MSETVFPKPVIAVVATVADILRHQGRTGIVELLENAHAWFDQTGFDNWNGGTYIWALRLEVPIHVFASVEPRLESIEKEIGSKLKYLDRLYPNDPSQRSDHFSDYGRAMPQRSNSSDTEVRRLWQDKRFRFLISHVSKHKVQGPRHSKRPWGSEVSMGLSPMRTLNPVVSG